MRRYGQHRLPLSCSPLQRCSLCDLRRPSLCQLRRRRLTRLRPSTRQVQQLRANSVPCAMHRASYASPMLLRQRRQPASTLKVPPRRGESVAERNAREKIAREHLDDGKQAMDEHRYSDAIDLLQRALDTSDRPDFGYTAGEAASLLKQASNRQSAADPPVK